MCYLHVITHSQLPRSGSATRMENLKIGKITCNLEQHENYNYETAKLSRIYSYTLNGKEVQHTFEISVYAHKRNFTGPLARYGLNLSAVGSIRPVLATAYAELLTEAVKVAERLTATYIPA